MTGFTLQTALRTAAPTAPRPARPTLATAAPAQLSAAEEARIADAFPARPTVAQRLYGPNREVHTAAPLGGRLDLSA